MSTDAPDATPADDPARGGDVVAVYMTFPNETTAIEVGEDLVDRRLAACVNVLPGATSIYRWEGAVAHDREVVAVAKTTRDRLAEAIAAVVEAHPYELPCVVAYPASDGSRPFLAWVAEESRPG
jgi:periplasmic divalent cation tolerance protein